MADQPVSSTFVRILKSFQSRLSSEDIENFRFTTFEDLKEAIKTIQQDQADRQGLRNLNKIRPFITILEQYSQVIEQFVTADPQILAFIWVRGSPFPSPKRTSRIILSTGPHKTMPSGMLIQL